MRIPKNPLHVVFAAVIVVAGFAAPQIARGEEIDNPQYQSWSKFKPGSTRTLAGEMSTQGMQMQMEMTSTLKDVTPEEATISTKVNVNMAGQTREQPAHERPVRAKVQKQDVEAVGEEDVEAAGRTYKCKIYEVKMESPMGRRGARGPQGDNGATTQPEASKSRIWVSSEVPGGVVKMAIRTPVGEMTMTLKSFEAK